MSLVVPSADPLGFWVDHTVAEGTGEVVPSLLAVGLGGLALILCRCRRPVVKPTVTQLPSGLRISHGSRSN